MANSYAFVLSKNTYPDAFQANLIGVDQGTQIVYTTTSTLTTANVLYADSRLTQPIYGDGTSWYGVQLLTNTSVVYPITISESGVIAIGSGTTTTTAGPTTTTTAAPTTTTTAAPTTTTTAAPSPTTYYMSGLENVISGAACSEQFLTIIETLYSSVSVVSSLTGATLYTNSGLTTPYVGTGNWYYLSTVNNNSLPGTAVQVNSSGLVLDQVVC